MIYMTDDDALLKMGIETQDESYNRLMDSLRDTCLRSADPILLGGDSGTGKTLLARRIYDLKKRRSALSGPFVEVDCVILHDGDTDFCRALQEADQGMLFLDDIDHLEAYAQRILLRVLETGRFRQTGYGPEINSAFQLVCAAGKNMGQLVSWGQFNASLFSQIGLWTFTLPSLKDRPRDLPPNIRYELNAYQKKNGLKIEFTREAAKLYLDFAQSPESPWKGNFRTLGQSIKRMCFNGHKDGITPDIVQHEIAQLNSYWDAITADDEGDFSEIRASVDTDREDTDGERDALKPAYLPEKVKQILENCDEFDRAQLVAAIEVCRESETLAAAGRKLFAKSRQKRVSHNDSDRLKKYLARFGLDWEGVKGS
jgi:transcriptional regulatory protein RtcR